MHILVILVVHIYIIHVVYKYIYIYIHIVYVYSICWCMYWMMKLMTCSNCLNSKMPKLPIENLAGKPPSGQNTRNNSIHEAFSLAGLRNYCLSHLKYGQQPSYGCMFCRLCTYIFVCTCAYVCVCVRAIHY